MSLNAFVRSLSVALGLAVVAGASAALSDLRDEPEIVEGLISTAIAYEIGQRCEELDARTLAGINYLWSLEARARELGYSREEIDAFIEDEAEKDRLEALARQRLRDKGGIEGSWDTYCAVGRAEIAAGSQIGRLLR